MRRFHERVVQLTRAALTGPGEAAKDGQTGEMAVLEVGCGEGFVLSYLRRHFPATRFCGVDVDLGALSEASQRNPGIPLTVADTTALPFADRSFPLVLCLEVLEHLPDPVGALVELQRVSAGHLLLSVPNQPFFALANLLRGKNWPTLGEDPEHVQHWSGRQFVELAVANLHVTRVVHSFPWVLVLARRLRS